MRYDLFYIKRMSPLLDLRIVFDSVKTVMFGRGAQSAELYDKQIPEQVVEAS